MGCSPSSLSFACIPFTQHADKEKLLPTSPHLEEPETEPEAKMLLPSSSFHLTFGSVPGSEEISGVPTSSVAATVLLLVSLEDSVDGARKDQQHWRKLEFLDRSIPLAAAGKLVRFSFSEIRSATRGFAKGRELGRSALSRVYKGRIGVVRRVVAIKRVDGKDRESVKDFGRELIIASSLRNSNVVPLIGFCVDNEGLFLVYKYVSGGSLDCYLHTQDNRAKPKFLPWKVRFKVAIDVANALEYLHFGSDKCIIHRDIKPSNILLSSKRKAKVCDFGLATWSHGPSLPFLCNSVKGTFGYLAPEYFQHGKLSDKTDVYAFGVVLLELITGRKAIDRDRPQGEENLVLWAKPLLQQGEQTLQKLIDPSLRPGCYDPNEMIKMACAASACVKSEESERPNIRQVIGMLQVGEIGSGDWPYFTDSGCISRNASHKHEPLEKSEMRRHMALAMLGISDNEEDESYRR